ncbi:hypothetical protein CC1G_02173 [Coprinopsis cinerea okayama7|uniref:Hydrophobin n=1 Tax=Coprinopsis cinerea (strain Okayama-7 / 130 / ATCC MYA-4618 / FGSC 9003) TaxID=240176 RepID=A8NKF8_COPC7|nr:hypothetical protein CC1G_02173 [Coprinopsis cinerea okayama7\|eukprot:XP_001834437.1 hypothetical protein CC1G_02173 [Coprinopsis cinerea okayama7\
MQFKTLSTLALLAATAAAGPLEARQSGGQCNTGPVQCCNSISSAKDPSTALLLGLLSSRMSTSPSASSAAPLLLSVSPETPDGIVAIGCTPINVNA